VERKSTLGARATTEVRKRVGRIKKKADAIALRFPQRALHQETEFSKSADVTRTTQAPVELTDPEIVRTRPHRHSYLTYTILLAIKFLISGLNSFRGIAKTFEILSMNWADSGMEMLSQHSPNFNTIRQWVLKLGLDELNRIKEYRSDWIFIVDMTIEIGKNKCLLILGIPQEKLGKIIKQEARSLQHQDVEVLSLEILDRTIGTVILEKLNNLAERVGTPLQIVSDRGSDIKKGIDLYLENNPMTNGKCPTKTIATYDITHKMANLLKHELSEDKRFQEFFKECSLTRQRIQQTDLCFLSPPTQRSKSRYHNIDILISWAMKIINYEEKQDFSAIDNTYILDGETYRSLSQSISRSSSDSLKRVKHEVYEDLDKFSQAMSNILTVEIWQIHQQDIRQAASLGRRKFYEKLGWLFSYRTEIQTYSQMLELISSVQAQVKNQGLHEQSLSDWLESLHPEREIYSYPPRVEKVKGIIEEYLADEISKIPDDLTMLGSSDVIESLFGKYKIFAQRRPIKEIGASILLIPLSTIEITINRVKEAMESTSFMDVVEWSKSIFGSSMLSRRKSLNSVANLDKEPA
jgi:hypothetical protein